MLHEDDVNDMDTWIQFAHQRAGVPFPVQKDRAGLGKIFKDFQETHPEGNWHCMVDVVRWAKNQRRHYGIVELLGNWKHAHQQGYMHILARGGSNDGETLNELLAKVDDESFRDRMVVARTALERDEIFQEYLTHSDGGAAAETNDDTSESFVDDRLHTGLVVRYRLTLAESPRLGTLLRQEGEKLVVYTGEREVPLPPRLIAIKVDNGWEAL